FSLSFPRAGGLIHFPFRLSCHRFSVAGKDVPVATFCPRRSMRVSETKLCTYSSSGAGSESASRRAKPRGHPARMGYIAIIRQMAGVPAALNATVLGGGELGFQDMFAHDHFTFRGPAAVTGERVVIDPDRCQRIITSSLSQTRRRLRSRAGIASPVLPGGFPRSAAASSVGCRSPANRRGR